MTLQDPPMAQSSLGNTKQSSSDSSSPKFELTDQTNLLPARKLIVIFIGLGLCVVMAAFDSVIVATALPTISSQFKAGSVSSWVPTAYLLSSTAFQPFLAMSIFMLGNIISGFSKTIVQLITARAIAGIGGGGIPGMMQIIVSDIVSLRERGKYQGLIGGIVSLGYTVGPLVGGALAETVGWEWCFWITVPPCFLATCGIIFILPLKPVEGDIKRKLKSVDYLGSFLTLAACTLLTLPLIWGGVTFAWNSAVILALLISGVVVIGIFCVWEWKGASLPIVPMYIFRQRTVTGVYICMFINGFVFFSSLYYLPQYFQVVLGYTPIKAGTFLIPLVLSQMMANWLSGVAVSKTGKYRRIINSGFAIWAIGTGCLSTITPHSKKAELVVFMLLSGLGAGQTMQTTTVACQASVPRKDMAVVTAFRNFVRLLGGVLALALGSTLVNNALRASMKSIDLPTDIIAVIIDDPATLLNPRALGISSQAASLVLNSGYTKGFRSLFLLHASLTTFATVTSLVMIKHKDLMRGDEERLKTEARANEKDKSGQATPTRQDIEMGDLSIQKEPAQENGKPSQ